MARVKLRTVPFALRGVRPALPGVGLAVILLLGAIVRFWHLDWDGGAYLLHPDEWALNQVVRRLGPDWNPHFFFYGSFPIYLDRLTAEGLRLLTGLDWLAPVRLPLIGRFYSALASTALLPLAFAVGRLLWGRGAGLLAAGYTASAALLIQAAHFGTVDTLVTLAGMLLLWLSLRILAGGGWIWYVLAGLMLGLAIATKLTAASFAILPVLAHFLRKSDAKLSMSKAQLIDSRRSYKSHQFGIETSHMRIALLAATALGALLLAAPYYLLDWSEFWQAIVTQNNELSGGYQFAYTWQFIGSTPYLFELDNLVRWGLGLPLGLAALAGWAWLILDFGSRILDRLRARRSGFQGRGDENRDQVQTVPLSTGYSALGARCLVLVWPLAYFLYIGTWEARFVRHLLPLVPWCCLVAAGGTVALARALRRQGRLGVAVAWVVSAAVALGAAGWGLAVFGIHTAPEPRLAATAWIAAHVPAGSVLVVEDKNDLVPVPGVGPPLGMYQFKPLSVTDPDTPAKMAAFASGLAAGDVLVVPNRRWAAVLPRLPAFPLTGQYYRLLFTGQLGYTPLATFADPPHLGPLAFPDDAAEETFQVFDHPTVRLFENKGRLPEAKLRAMLGAGP